MNPWTILEWVASVGLSVVLTVAVIFGVAIGIRYLVNITSGKFWVKKKTRATSTTSRATTTKK